MAFENIFRKASVVLVAGAYGLWSYHAITRHFAGILSVPRCLGVLR
jgi:hypothetical protein